MVLWYVIFRDMHLSTCIYLSPQDVILMYVAWQSFMQYAEHFTQIGGGYQSHDLADICLAWMAVSRYHPNY